MTIRVHEVDSAGRHFLSFQRIASDPETGEEIYLGCSEVDVLEPDSASSVLLHVRSELSLFEE
jgi:hypothetical protein